MSKSKFNIGDNVTCFFKSESPEAATILEGHVDVAGDGEFIYRVKYADGSFSRGWIAESDICFGTAVTSSTVEGRVAEVRKAAREGDFEAVSSLERSLYLDYIRQRAEEGDALAKVILGANVDCPRW
jgi:hypothetical protein